VDTRWNTGQQLGVACGAESDGRERFRRRIRGQATRNRAGTRQFAGRAGDAVAARPPRPSLGTTRRRRSGTPTGAAHVGRGIRRPPATPRAWAAARAGADAATP